MIDGFRQEPESPLATPRPLLAQNGMPLNLSKYLDRLGLTTEQQPHLLDTLQPTVLVADLSHLASNPQQCSYVVGGSGAAGAGAFCALQVLTPVPLCVRFLATINTNTNVRMEIGVGLPSIALANPVNVTPQLFQTRAAQARWQFGDAVAALGVGFPTRRVLSTINAGVFSPPLIVPAGGFATWTMDIANSTLHMEVRVDELPGDLIP